MNSAKSEFSKLSKKTKLIILAGIVVVGGFLAIIGFDTRSRNEHVLLKSQPKENSVSFTPTAAQWKSMTVAPVTKRVFRAEHVTEGKIAVNDDQATPIFSPYSGRVIRLHAKAGDTVEAGQPLFVVEAADMVQAQNDFITVLTAVNKARAQRAVAETAEKRHRDLYNEKAVALRELEQAQATLVAANSDLRSAQTALEAGRNRLRLLGKTDEEITAFEETGKISAETTIYAPISGTVVQRKVGPGQFVNSGASEPVFVVGDLSSVWLVAFVRESDALKIHTGQQIQFTTLAQPDQIHRGNISYVAATFDVASRRLMVRATILNSQSMLKPEMFATVSIFTDDGDVFPAVPREAVIYEGSKAHVWVATPDQVIEMRGIVPGVTDGDMVQVMDGLRSDERVVTKGSLFLDRLVTGRS
jgi:membrane fusion protein, heavy metal efflux system